MLRDHLLLLIFQKHILSKVIFAGYDGLVIIL